MLGQIAGGMDAFIEIGSFLHTLFVRGGTQLPHVDRHQHDELGNKGVQLPEY